MQVRHDDRPIPITTERARTELVRSRHQLDAARRSLELSVSLFRTLDARIADVVMNELERALGQLEEAEATLWEAVQ